MPAEFPPIEDLIPHRGPMCLLRRIVALDGCEVTAEALLPPEAGVLSGAAGSQAWSVEIVAQAAAAFIGWHHRERGWRSGRLIKVVRWELSPEPLPGGEILTVYSKLGTWSEAGLFRFDGQLSAASGHRLAAGQLTILTS
ncbi:hypothetical protein H5P28_08960 [Ruficoccus amylovorans]|uniref:Uncharacterized protein n=1 Tax=Ruficoccus amylovorans TaxID=1804625 RepID=A0A842HCZ4_9BACT|nr:hypothetical protein [Ruficoccus amylovorans]MBC2594385.1 hypothetical protein [Ruficoccus amylovorans]